jgi:hypothetical protein
VGGMGGLRDLETSMHGWALGGWHSISLRVLLALISIFGSVARLYLSFPSWGLSSQYTVFGSALRPRLHSLLLC